MSHASPATSVGLGHRMQGHYEEPEKVKTRDIEMDKVAAQAL